MIQHRHFRIFCKIKCFMKMETLVQTAQNTFRYKCSMYLYICTSILYNRQYIGAYIYTIYGTVYTVPTLYVFKLDLESRLTSPTLQKYTIDKKNLKTFTYQTYPYMYPFFYFKTYVLFAQQIPNHLEKTDLFKNPYMYI